MTELNDLEATRQALRELARVVQTTRRTLAAILAHKELQLWNQPELGQFSDTLEHIGEVREGFILSQRNAPTISISVLRDIVRHVMLDWDWLQSLNLSVMPSEEAESLDQQLIFYNHALIALGILPQLPATAITFPQRRPTYSDVTVPSEPGEMLERIEEIERTIYQADFMPQKELAHGPLRRTYAFFEASSWLVDNHLKPLL